ncbi:MAG: MFS transporter [Oscillospiraceae bacterium]|jgi:sugar phosphate permease|nr:MFS transporter [Oscillospiraceae bacterium]
MARVAVMHEEKKHTRKWKQFFSEPPAKNQSLDNKLEIKKKYVFWRNSIFITSYILYVIAYMARKNFSIAMPFMENEIGINAADQGLILMVASFVYGIGRFVNGSIADRGNVRVSLPINMILAGGFNAAIALTPFLVNTQQLSHSAMVAYMCLFWGISSWYQSALFPYCAKSLIRWFPNATRATWWANWSTSHELGSFLAMNISLPIASLAYMCFGKYGLEAMFVVPFVFSLLIGIIGFFALRDRPVSIGLPDVEKICETKLEALTEEEKKEQDLEDNLTYFQILKKHILYNKVMWNLALIYFCVYIFRMGPVDWIFKILVGEQPRFGNFHEAVKNIDNLAALKSSMLCAIGFLGIFFAPIISEKWFKGRRAPANFWCLFVGAFSVIGIWLGSSPFSPVANMPFWKNVVTFISLGVAGFTVCVPQVLVGGISAVESTSKKVAAAASGFTGFLGYFGASLSQALNGKVLSYSMGKYGDARLVLFYWGAISLVGALLCIPLWNVRARKEYSH